MSFIGGYQSDINLLNFVGDFPIDHSIGGFGHASGPGNNYVLTLVPPIGSYRVGMLIEVMFMQINSASITINVNGKGAKIVKKIVLGSLVNLEPGDISTDKIYLLVYDGEFFQVVNSQHFLFDATELRKGISQIATDVDVLVGTDNSKIITPAKLKSYIADKITGLWDNRGTLDCSANPLYPEALEGYAFVVSAAGKIGGMGGVTVQLRDVIYCTASNAGGSQAAVGNSWNVIQANLEQATEILAGFARLATTPEALAGINNQTIITPATLKAVTDTLSLSGGTPPSATEEIPGIIEIATLAEVNGGTDNQRAVTPLKLSLYIADKITGLWKNKGLLNCSTNPFYPPGVKGDAYTISGAGIIGGMGGVVVEVKDVLYCNADNPGGNQTTVGASWSVIQANLVQATELVSGYVRLATQAEALSGINNTAVITPFTLQAVLASIPPSTPPSATEEIAGILEIATQAEVDTGTDNQRAVTPQKLKQYVADRITGLWKNQGLIDCSANPNYPLAKKGDAYTVSTPGRIGGALGIVVEVRDVIYCNNDNAGGSQAAVGVNWSVIQGNLEQATETLLGYSRIATQTDVNTGLDDLKFVTAFKLKNLLDIRIKPMRAQIRFYSDSIVEDMVGGGGPADYGFGTINVTGIPPGANIVQATLIWEGTIRNTGGPDNEFISGSIALSRDLGPYTPFLSMNDHILMDMSQISFFRFVVKDVTSVVIGNAPYHPRFIDLSAQFFSLLISGFWILEIDYIPA